MKLKGDVNIYLQLCNFGSYTSNLQKHVKRLLTEKDDCWIIAPVKERYPIKGKIKAAPLYQFINMISQTLNT